MTRIIKSFAAFTLCLSTSSLAVIDEVASQQSPARAADAPRTLNDRLSHVDKESFQKRKREREEGKENRRQARARLIFGNGDEDTDDELPDDNAALVASAIARSQRNEELRLLRGDERDHILDETSEERFPTEWDSETE